MDKLLLVFLLVFSGINHSCFRDGEGNKIARTKTCLNQLELMITEEIAYHKIPEKEFSAETLLEIIGLDSMDSCLKDGWGRWFVIYHNVEDKSIKIWSLGPDGINDYGGNDDIVKTFNLK